MALTPMPITPRPTEEKGGPVYQPSRGGWYPEPQKGQRPNTTATNAATFAYDWQCCLCGAWFESSAPPILGPSGQLCSGCAGD
ncbi:hypothetical protein [Streptomyces sp. NPDC127098]|uniref:hypothetical protein n=1 Tax=Streptomyces sp. NPDC127098 TaxID=3347137 RepID=UPI0036560B6B